MMNYGGAILQLKKVNWRKERKMTVDNGKYIWKTGESRWEMRTLWKKAGREWSERVIGGMLTSEQVGTGLCWFIGLELLSTNLVGMVGE